MLGPSQRKLGYQGRGMMQAVCSKAAAKSTQAIVVCLMVFFMFRSLLIGKTILNKVYF